MKIGRWAGLGLLAALPLLTGCGNFWQDPNSSSTSSFSLTASPTSLTVGLSATSTTSTITVTPGSSFTGTVALTCAVTTTLSGATAPTCNLGSTSLTFSSSTAQTTTVAATTLAGTTLGAYTFKVTGVSGNVAESTSLCVEVSTTSGTCSTAATNSGNFYILNNDAISGYSIVSGQLTAITDGKVKLTGVTPYAIAMAPNGKFLCVSSTAGVYAYPITSGALGTGVKVTSDAAYALQVDSTDSWLLEAVPYDGGGGVYLYAVNVNSTTGTQISGTSEASAPFTISGAFLPLGQMFLSKDNAYIFVALETGGTIVVPFSSSNPLPSGVTYLHIPAVNSGGSDLSVAVDPSSTPRLFYIGEISGDSAGTSGGLRAFVYSDLPTLTEIATSKIASGGLAPTYILPVATPDYVYVADEASSITGFEVTGSSASTYALATGATVTAGDKLAGMAEDSTGSYVFEVGSSGSPYFDAYTFDSNTTGQLDSYLPSTVQATSIAIVAAP